MSLDFTELFYKTFAEFLEQMVALYPNDSIMKGYTTKFNIVNYIRPPFVIKTFQDILLPYEREIIRKDDSFFINSDFSSEIGTYSDQVGQEELIEELNRIKSIFLKASDTNKQIIWKYMQTIIVCLGKLKK
jgi:hypothetical protein